MRIAYRHVISTGILILTIIVAAAGLFSGASPLPHEVVNQYGDVVRLYGSGLYAHDSFFRAPIFRGTDFTMLLVSCPLLLYTVIADLKRRTEKSKLFLVSVIAVFAYYATSIAFGVAYNQFHLLYILLFSLCFYGLMVSIVNIERKVLAKSVHHSLSLKGIYIFLIITGAALLVAWLPDNIAAIVNQRPPAMIETYTVETTYVIDMGIIAPASFICLYLLKKKNILGFVLLDILLTLCIVIGIMLPVQTIFQEKVGIHLPAGVLITKMGSFSALSLFALYFKWRLTRNIVTDVKAGSTMEQPFSSSIV